MIIIVAVAREIEFMHGIRVSGRNTKWTNIKQKFVFLLSRYIFNRYQLSTGLSIYIIIIYFISAK